MMSKHQDLMRKKDPDYIDKDLEGLIGGLDGYQELCLEAYNLCDGVVSETLAWGRVYGLKSSEALDIAKIVSRVKGEVSAHSRTRNKQQRVRNRS